MADTALAVVCAPRFPTRPHSPTRWRSGIRALELTFTTPGVLDHLRAASASEAMLGMGTVLSADQARGNQQRRAHVLALTLALAYTPNR